MAETTHPHFGESQGHPPGEDPFAFFDQPEGPFYRKIDWISFGITFLIALAVYTYTTAPTVTLEDSGELVVASDYLGVPHPPGYPIWTLLTWFFQWVFHFVTYHGHPNPAWAVNWFSAVSGAAACAILALLVSRSGGDMIRRITSMEGVLSYDTQSLITCVGGITAGLLLAFSHGMWSQSVIAEVYSLNIFFEMLLLLLTYQWLCRPRHYHLLYIIGYVFGLGLTNHQTLMFLLPGLGIAGILRLLLLVEEDETHGSLFANLVMRIPIILACVALGVSFYLYMPVSSEQNPPMNWGYARTPEGFRHAITRGQYERIQPAQIFADPGLFLQQLGTYFRDLRRQFTATLALLGIVPFLFLHRIGRRGIAWLLTTLVSFFFLSIVLVIFLNPSLDIQTLFIQRVQLIQSHAVYALWLGYGLIFTLATLEAWAGGAGVAKYVGLALTVALPIVPIWRNAFNEEIVTILGGAEQRSHDFGWQFGAYQLLGVEDLIKDIEEGDEPLPNPAYPPPMDERAIFFGGTDPGRFVPTYMIYSAKVRPDVYLITQNALADNTYMAVMRDLYGAEIWIPSQADSNNAFRRYVEDVQAGRIQAGADVEVRDGRVSVQGVGGVMAINGILARDIFENNKHRHSFYVEESYVIPWMYPHLSPHGLIMKINPEPLPRLTDEMVRNDMEFWDWYSRRLLNNPRFRRDVVARKTFSKLRSAIGGLYVYRRLFPEAEQALQEAVDLYDLSPEANFRLADVYMQQGKVNKAIELIEAFLEKDPRNENVQRYLEQIRGRVRTDTRRIALEAKMHEGIDINEILELMQIYRDLNQIGEMEAIGRQIISDPRIPPEASFAVAAMSAQVGRMGLANNAMRVYTDQAPEDPRGWIELAALQVAVRQNAEALESIAQAVRTGGDEVRNHLRQDQRFEAIRNEPAFREHVPQAAMPSFRF